MIECAVNPDAAAEVPNFIKRFHPNFPVGYNPDPMNVLNFLQHPAAAVPHMPMLAFIDRRGVIRDQYQGVDAMLNDDARQEDNLRGAIAKLVAIK